MDIYTYKEQFEQYMLSPDGPPPAQQAWTYFKDSICESLDEDYVEEFGFSMGYASSYDSREFMVRYNKESYCVYFGRLIDAEKSPWTVASINCYFCYAINDELRLIAEASPHIDIESYYSKSDTKDIIKQKTEEVFLFADEKQFIWDAIRDLHPTRTYIYFRVG